jgi:hypothetical protein
LLKIIELSTPTSISAKKDFRHITENIDSVRNEDWKQIFPEVFKLLTG